MASSDSTEYSVRYFSIPQNERPRTHVDPEPEGLSLHDEVEFWRTSAEDDEVLRIVAGFAGWDTSPPHRADPEFLDADPVFFLESSIRRIEDLEDRKNLTEQLTFDAREALIQLGCTASATGISGQLVALVTPECLDELLGHEGLTRVFSPQIVEPHRNDGIGIREGHQIQQFLDNGLTGELGSGRSSFGNDILIGVIDQTIDPDHPAWRDTSSSSSSRLRAIRCWLGNNIWTGAYCTPSTNVPFNSNDQHGTRVAGQALADLTQNQNGNQGFTWEHARTGMSTESHMVFYGIFGLSWPASPSTSAIVAQEIADGVDIVVRSYGPTIPICGLQFDLEPLYTEFSDGIFHVSSAGNNGNGGNCNVAGQPAHPAVFTVGALNTGGDLRSANVASYSSIGGDGFGRTFVNMVAIGGRQSTSVGGSGTMASYNNWYGCAWPCVGTSFAAPVVAGAAANLKHQMINKLGATTINQPGRMHALMLLMGDRQTQSGPSSSRMDNLWGAGRLAMRKFNNAGMDFPWAFHSARLQIGQGQTIRLGVSTGNALFFPSTPSTNPALSSDVDEIRAVAWWYESPGALPANIRLRLRKVSSSSYIAVTGFNGTPQHRRVHTASPNGGTWELQITGTNVPFAAPPNLPGVAGQQVREVHVAWFWEDGDRDDTNGPASTIR